MIASIILLLLLCIIGGGMINFLCSLAVYLVDKYGLLTRSELAIYT